MYGSMSSGRVVLRLNDASKSLVSASTIRQAANRGDAAEGLLRECGRGRRRSALGAFAPGTSTILGVVVFLRLGFVVGQAGVWASLAIVAGSFVLCLLTTLSLCALISDGGDHVTIEPGGPRATKDPGVYCALRKSVGPQIGAAIGAAFYLAFTVDVAFYIIGFAEVLSSTARLRSVEQALPPR